jgi:hypothetical protein
MRGTTAANRIPNRLENKGEKGCELKSGNWESRKQKCEP